MDFRAATSSVFHSCFLLWHISHFFGKKLQLIFEDMHSYGNIIFISELSILNIFIAHIMAYWLLRREKLFW